MGKKKQKSDINLETQRLTGKAVGIVKKGAIVGEADRIEGEFGGKIYITSLGKTSKTRQASIKIHKNESAAVNRISRRYPSITPRLRKKL